MTLFLFWWTNKHTCTPEEKRLPLSGRMLRDSAVCSAESHRNWPRRHKSLVPPTIHKKSERQDRRKWTPIGRLASRRKSCLLFCQICRKNLLLLQHRHTDTVPTIPMSRPNVRATRRGCYIKTVINFNVMIKLSKHSLKISPQLLIWVSYWFWRGGVYKIEAV